MELTVSKDPLDGNDPILILSFLTRFVREANGLHTTKAQAYLAFPFFLRGFGAVPDDGGISVPSFDVVHLYVRLARLNPRSNINDRRSGCCLTGVDAQMGIGACDPV